MRKIAFYCMIVLLLNAAGTVAQETTETIVTAEQVKKWLEKGDGMPIVFTRMERYADYGSIPGVEVIDIWKQEGGHPAVSAEALEELVKKFGKEGSFILLDWDPGYQRIAAETLHEHGFNGFYLFENALTGERESRDSDVYHPGWIAHGLPWEPGTIAFGHYSHDDGVTIVDADTVRSWLDQNTRFTIIDVRSAPELTRYGKPTGSVHIPLWVRQEVDGEMQWLQNPEFVRKVQEAAGDSKVLTICTLSMRAAQAAELLEQSGMKEVYVFRHGIQGRTTATGITRGWRAHNLPYEYPAEKDQMDP